MKARRWVLSALALLLIAVGGGLGYAESQRPLLELGVGYAARIGCGCRYIGNRPIGDCVKDFEPGMELISLRDDPATRTVTASVPFTASRSATFDPVLGCQPEVLRR